MWHNPVILYLYLHPAGLANLRRDEGGGLLMAEINYKKDFQRMHVR
jgi:hypothetical protein